MSFNLGEAIPVNSSSSFANALWKDVDKLMSLIIPTRQSNQIRDAIASYLKQILKKGQVIGNELNSKERHCDSSRQHSFLDGSSCGDDDGSNCETIDNYSILLMLSGSCCSKTYLPDGDIDLVMITHSLTNFSSIGDLKDLTSIFSSLCAEIFRKEQENKPSQIMQQSSSIRTQQSQQAPSSIAHEFTPEYAIRNVEFINARTKLLHCFVDSYSVDITLNQIGIIASMLFIEEVDREIGENHLFKRSILLIKCWCLHESRLYCGLPIIGSKEGMFSSYAISIMVMHLFNFQRDSLHHPLEVLRTFLSYYQKFPWETHVLTLEGPYPIQIGVSHNANSKSDDSSMGNKNHPDGKYRRCVNRFFPILDRLGREIQAISPLINENLLAKKKLFNPSLRFTFRACNIQDPVDDTNNLGFSVARNNLPLIERAFQVGSSRLESLLACSHVSNPSVTNTLAVPPPLPMQPPLQISSQQIYHRFSNSNNSNANNTVNGIPNSVLNSPNHSNHFQPQHSSLSSMSPSHFPLGNNDINVNNKSSAVVGGSGNFTRSSLPFYPFPSIPQRSTTGNAINTSVPLPPPLFTPLTPTANIGNASSKLQPPTNPGAFLSQPHPIDSFFGLSLQHYSMLMQQSTTAADDNEKRRQSYSSINEIEKNANNNVGCKDGKSKCVYKDLSTSDESDPLVTNQDILFKWLQRAESLAHREQLQPLHPSLTSLETESLKRHGINENVEALFPANIKPVDVSSPFLPYHGSSIPTQIIMNDDSNRHYFMSHKEDLDKTFNRNGRNNNSQSDGGIDKPSDLTLSQGGLRRSPSPSSSTCSSLSSAITTLPESLDTHQLSPDQVSSSSLLLHPHMESVPITGTPSTTLCSDDNRRDSLSSTDDPFPYEENHHLKEFNLHHHNINNKMARSVELFRASSPDVSKQNEQVHQKDFNTDTFAAIKISDYSNNKNASVVLNNNILSKSHGMAEKLTKSQQKRLKQLQHSKNPKTPLDRNRSDSVRSQNSVNSSLSREEKGIVVNASANHHDNCNLLGEDVHTVWCVSLWNSWIGKRQDHVHSDNGNTTISGDTTSSPSKRIKAGGSRGVQSAAVLAAVQRRHQLQHYHTYSWTVCRGWLALVVAALSLTGIVVLNVYTERPNSHHTYPTSTTDKRLEQNKSVINSWSKDSQAYFSQLLNLTSSLSSTVSFSSQPIQQHTASIQNIRSNASKNNITETSVPMEMVTENTAIMSESVNTDEQRMEDILFATPSVPTHWVQVGESLIFGHDLQQLGNDYHPVDVSASKSSVRGSVRVVSVDGSTVLTSLRGSGGSVTATNANDNNNFNSHLHKSVDDVGHRGYYYLWTKDDLPISVSAQPLFTIPQTVLSDSGHYRCYAFLPFPSQQTHHPHTHHKASASLWQALTVFAAFLSTDTNEDTAVSQQSPVSLPQRQLLLQQRAKLEQLLTSFASDISHHLNSDKMDSHSYWQQWLSNLPQTASVLSAKQIPRFLHLSHSVHSPHNNNKMVFPWSERNLQELFSSPMMLQQFSHDSDDALGSTAFELVTETRISISKKPRVRNRPFYQEVKQGRPFYLPLDVEAIPAATFQWYKNGYPLSDQRQSVLLLEAVDAAATGTYSCEVQNIAGKVLWLEATIHVVD